VTSPDELLASVERFVSETVLPSVDEWDRSDDLPGAVVAKLASMGLAGALVPAAYGGPGLGVADLVPAWRALSQGWISLTGAVNPTGLATALLVRHGTEEQRARWLPAIASGACMASFSITEPQAGSDIGRIETRARPLDAGSGPAAARSGSAPSPAGLVLDGEKRWVAGGASSDVIFMMVEVDGSAKPSCVVLPAEGRDSDSWRVEDLDKVGYRGVESAAYVFDSHEAPGAEVLGGEDGLGSGARFMLDALDVGRVNVACRALGIIDRAIACAVEECVERAVGDGMLGDHTHAQLRVGEMVARRAAAEALVDRAAAAVDARAANPTLADEARELSTSAKVIASDTAVWAVDRAARLAASRSYAAGDELARLRRDAPQTQIGEGANDALLLALASPVLDGARGGETS
jgi:alkylation response protein AidB-like acyl-CoA dehydrogenase